MFLGPKSIYLLGVLICRWRSVAERSEPRVTAEYFNYMAWELAAWERASPPPCPDSPRFLTAWLPTAPEQWRPQNPGGRASAQGKSGAQNPVQLGSQG